MNRKLSISLWVVVSGLVGCFFLEEKKAGVEFLNEWHHQPGIGFGYYFARSITNDAHDQAKAYYETSEVLRKVEGSLQAFEMAESLENWRAGLLWSDLARDFVLEGNLEASRQCYQAALSWMYRATEWRRDRIRQRLLYATAFFEPVEFYEQSIQKLASFGDVSSFLSLRQAVLLMRGGDVQGALEALVQNPEAGPESRVQDLLTLGHSKWAESDDFDALFEAAWIESANIRGLQKLMLRADLLEAWKARGAGEQALLFLDELTRVSLGLNTPPHLQIMAMTRVAVVNAHYGNKDSVNRIRAVVEPLLEEVMSIERPRYRALLGEAFAILDDKAEATEFYKMASSEASALVNPRPRALAGVDIALSMVECGLDSSTILDILTPLSKTF